MRRLLNSHRDENGATLVEYSLLIVLIALACVAAMSTLGVAIADKLSSVGDTISSV